MKQNSRLRSKSLVFVSALTLAVSGLLPLTMGSATAAQITNRSIELESAQAGSGGQNIYHEFKFTVPTGTTLTNLGSVEFTYCTTPLGACTAPTGLDLRTTGGSYALGTGSAADQGINGSLPANTFAKDTAGETANRIRIKATSTNSIAANDDVLFHFTGIENPTTSSYSPNGNNTFFVRITAWSSTAYGGGSDNGVVAAAIVPLLTVSARVQEILNFCVGSTTVNDGTTSVAADCAALAGSPSIDLGVADTTTTGAVTDGSTKAHGVFMVRSNAVNGTTIGYRAVQQTGTTYKGSLRVVGATCSGASNTVAAANSQTDMCFNSNAAKTALTASVEEFGMTGKFINRASSGTPTANLALATDYDSTGVEGYAWDQSGAFVSIADSNASTDKVLDDEAVVLKFAAVAALTTPTGQYQAQGDFIAVTTY